MLEKPVKIAVIGCGGYAHQLIIRIQTTPLYGTITAVTSRDLDSEGARYCKAHGINVFQSVEELLAYGEFEVVVNPTPIQPTPIQPTPIQPTPIQPTPINPPPINPTPINPTATAQPTQTTELATATATAAPELTTATARKVDPPAIAPPVNAGLVPGITTGPTPTGPTLAAPALPTPTPSGPIPPPM